jgi:hypothetical protein
MRRIKKECGLSSEYLKWVEQLESEGEDHAKYHAGHKYYLDVVMNLFHCQMGLCAYTEMHLCGDAHFASEHWRDGRYSSAKPGTFGDLDHFDPTLKIKRGWLWANFFVIHGDINTKAKGHKEVDYILKPDAPDYDEYALLEYDEKVHQFIANTNLPEDKQIRINKMILTLGINFDAVKDHRKDILNPVAAAMRLKVSFNPPNQFPTAFEMMKRARAGWGN